MRGTVAKELRKQATFPNTGEVNRGTYKLLKREYKKLDTLGRRLRSQHPKFDMKAIKRWEQSPLHRAKMTADGLHLSTFRPVRSIGVFYRDLNDKGKSVALNISRVAGWIPRPELLARVEALKSNKEFYEEGVV